MAFTAPPRLWWHALLHPPDVCADLGYQGTEAYGISYKARGLCKDLSNLDIYNDHNGPNVHVAGDIFKSDLHHNVSIHTAVVVQYFELLPRCLLR